MSACRRTVMRPFLGFSVVTTVATLALATLIAPGHNLALAQPNVTGRWTQPTDTGADWGHIQVHLALMRGNGTSPHSYIWSWRSGTALGLRGWNPGAWDSQNPGLLNGTTFPSANFPVISTSLFPGVDVFCSGHASLNDGRLLVAGGTDSPESEAGITASRIFDPSSLTWSNPGPMAERRWYPTLTQLPSGTQILSTGGNSFDHMLAYGGTQDPTSSTSNTRGEIQRFQLTLAGQWDAHGNQTGTSQPNPREGHSAVVLSIPGSAPAMVIYGGRTTEGGLLGDVWTMTPQQTDTGENYAWSELNTQGATAPLCVRHSAVARPTDNSMLVFGGKDDSSTVDQVHRLTRSQLGIWSWALLAPSGTAPKRSGHAAIYDAAKDRMLVFGGRDESGTLSTGVFELSLGATPTWTAAAVSGSPPQPRDGHTMVVDPNEYTRSGLTGSWKRILLFGGHNGTARKNDVWNLWIKNGTGDLGWEEVNASGGPPGRTRHAAVWDDGALRMVVFGGDVGGASSDDDVWVLKRDENATNYNNFTWQHLIPDAGLGVSGQTVVTARSTGFKLFARQPERFTLGGSWSSSPFERKHQGWYPNMFVLPSGNVFYAGPQSATRILNLSTGAWGAPITSSFWGSTAVSYLPGSIMKCGTAHHEGGQKYTATIMFNQYDQPNGWTTLQGQMGKSRHDLNLTMLPNGKVIATGGRDLSDNTSSSPAPGPEIWDPAAGTWSGYGTLAEDPITRIYHSCALILPDGRILSAGGDGAPNISRATIFTPPYLFDPNGKFVDDPLAEPSYKRPVIAGRPCRVAYGTQFEVRSPQAQDFGISGGSACLIRPGATTHSFNQDQRFVPLPIANCPGGDRLRIWAPADSNLAPPGDYLLFLVNAMGVPSIAQWVRIGTVTAWDCTDVTAPAQPTSMFADLLSDTEAWMVWTAPGDDGTGGAAVSEYDLRGSTQPITDNASLCAGIRGTAPSDPGPPLVGPGQLQDGAVRGLAPCTQYRFAAKARDDKDGWGSISSQVIATTMCEGGGGGGTRAHPVNPVTASADPGRNASDASVAGAEVGVASGACIAELRLTAGGPAWWVYSATAEQADAIFGADSAGILVQEPDARAGWRTLSRRFPIAGSTGFALRGFGRAVRYVFRGPNTLQHAWDNVASGQLGEVYRVATARHSRLGDQTTLVRTPGGARTLALDLGDTLTIAYESAAESAGVAREGSLLIGTSAAAVQPTKLRLEDRPGPLELPMEFALEAVRPNPFVRSTTVDFALPHAVQVRLEVFDLLGRRVGVLADGQYAAGRHTAVWNGRASGDQAASPGVYLLRITAGEFRGQRSMVLLP